MITEGGDDIDIGGNAAEGEEDEGSEAVKVCNVVSSGRFQQTSFGKKDYVACYKAYMKVRRLALRSRASRPGPGPGPGPGRGDRSARELSACVCVCACGWSAWPHRKSSSTSRRPTWTASTASKRCVLRRPCQRAHALPPHPHYAATHRALAAPTQQGAQAAIKKIVGMWDELEFYLGEGEEAFEGQIILSYWKEGADAPSFWFIKDGLDEEKC